MTKHTTDNCYLTYSDEEQGGGYLICTYNHKSEEECLLTIHDLLDIHHICSEQQKET